MLGRAWASPASQWKILARTDNLWRNPPDSLPPIWQHQRRRRGQINAQLLPVIKQWVLSNTRLLASATAMPTSPTRSLITYDATIYPSAQQRCVVVVCGISMLIIPVDDEQQAQVVLINSEYKFIHRTTHDDPSIWTLKHRPDKHQNLPKHI